MRVEESTAVLKAIAAGNGKTMPRRRLTLPRATTGPPATVLDTFKVRELRKRMVILMFCWFVASMSYYGVSLALEDLPGSLYTNFFLIAVVEFPSYFFTIMVRVSHPGLCTIARMCCMRFRQAHSVSVSRFTCGVFGSSASAACSPRNVCMYGNYFEIESH